MRKKQNITIFPVSQRDTMLVERKMPLPPAPSRMGRNVLSETHKKLSQKSRKTIIAYLFRIP
jgi:hypothetical protein